MERGILPKQDTLPYQIKGYINKDTVVLDGRSPLHSKLFLTTSHVTTKTIFQPLVAGRFAHDRRTGVESKRVESGGGKL